MAAHLGVVTDLPSIGVAKSNWWAGSSNRAPKLVRIHRCWMATSNWAGAAQQVRCKPLFVAGGHRVSADTALGWVQRTLRGYRLPEPTRLADRLASRRDE